MVNKKRTDIVRLLTAIAILILLNFITSLQFFRFDLTAEKRFTLSNETKSLLEGLEDVVYFEVYLEGDFPAGFERLAQETEHMLQEFRAYSDNIDYVFVNPSESENQDERYQLYAQLQEKGLIPSTVQVQKGDNTSQQVIFPGALVRLGEKEEAVQLMVSEQAPAEVILNASVQALEYELANAIRKLTSRGKPTIAFLTGHDELAKEEVLDLTNSLKEFYNVERIDLREYPLDTNTNQPSILAQQRKLGVCKALIIAKPRKAFTKLDQFLVDQYIMRGGKVLWFVDMVEAEMDSLATNNRIASLPRTNLGFDKQLFTYGVRVNNDLVQDLEAAPILIPESTIGSSTQWKLAPWYYFPMARNNASHPITDNINPVRAEFANSIDSVMVEGVKKTVLLTSSKSSRVATSPNIITLDLLLTKPDQNYFSKSDIPMAMLLEGKFTSHFKFSFVPKAGISENLEIIKESRDNKMIVVADGDLIRNQTHKGETVPLGVDKWTYNRTNHIYGNKTFVLNAVDYLLDDTGLSKIRNREVELRLLNKTTVVNNRNLIKFLNVGLPIILILIIGLILRIIRKKKYAVRYEE